MPKKPQYPDDYTITLPEYAGDSHFGQLLDLIGTLYSGQGDPLYAVMSRRSNGRIAYEEIDAINDALEEFLSGKFAPSYEPDDPDLTEEEASRAEEEWDQYYEDLQVAEDWKPVIEELMKQNEDAYYDRVERGIEEEESRKREIYDRYNRR